jgi:hypothetical protein
MSASVYKINATGAAAIAASMTVPAGRAYRLISVSVKFSAAPTTSESLTITLDANAGAAYDALLYTINPSLLATTVICWFPDQPLYLEGGDAIDVAFTNTDTRTYGVQITVVEAVT